MRFFNNGHTLHTDMGQTSAYCMFGICVCFVRVSMRSTIQHNSAPPVCRQIRAHWRERERERERAVRETEWVEERVDSHTDALWLFLQSRCRCLVFAARGDFSERHRTFFLIPYGIVSPTAGNPVENFHFICFGLREVLQLCKREFSGTVHITWKKMSLLPSAELRHLYKCEGP